MKSAELILHHTAEASSDPALITLAAKVQKTNEAVAALHAVTSDWVHWSAAHYDNRASYGSLEVSGGSVMRFEILQFNISALTDMLHSEDAPVLVDFYKSNTAGDLDTLRAKLLTYCQNVKGQSDSIAGSDHAMVADGLQPHQDDIAKALAALS
ncbi:hypothetical protein NM208_g14193 [Fusarium decemcellulare]|uniref:Uncharacterized protein n=1 Tax=Fusarium decemcellulare TaxID=57161 RepID=A0ACC1RIT1_9HYPO|nr:hypothetical protein NM208_g14193 [Fusarium decemcellulare]